MSCNNYQSYYNSCYGYPCVTANVSYYGKSKCDNGCGNCTNYCTNYCNPCQTVCQPTTCPSICQSYCPPVCPPTPAPICPTVAYVNNITTPTAVPAGGIAIPAGTVIPANSTTVPAGTVTVINGFTGIPTTNIGGIVPNNGFFTVPIAGRYVLAANVAFASVATVAPTDVRELYIYRVDATTGLVTLLAVDTRAPVAGVPTNVNIATVADLNAGDRIFVAALQTNVPGAVVSTVASVGRIAITRTC